MVVDVIYFPYIRVPNNEWFTRTLLFWDNIGSIVPMEFMRNREQLGPYMNNLIKEKLVTPIIPAGSVQIKL